MHMRYKVNQSNGHRNYEREARKDDRKLSENERTSGVKETRGGGIKKSINEEKIIIIIK